MDSYVYLEIKASGACEWFTDRIGCVFDIGCDLFVAISKKIFDMHYTRFICNR